VFVRPFPGWTEAGGRVGRGGRVLWAARVASCISNSVAEPLMRSRSAGLSFAFGKPQALFDLQRYRTSAVPHVRRGRRRRFVIARRSDESARGGVRTRSSSVAWFDEIESAGEVIQSCHQLGSWKSGRDLSVRRAADAQQRPGTRHTCNHMLYNDRLISWA